jgi:RND family efflux transporter MFP subunit
VENADVVRAPRFAGSLRAADRATLAFTVSGRLMARPVDIGSRVEAGAEVARLDPEPFEHAVAEARAGLADLQTRLDQALRDHERVRGLIEAKAATTEELEQREAAVKALEANLTAVQTRLAETRRLQREARLTAPFSGTVTEVLMEPGEFASAGRGVLILSGDQRLEMEVELPESSVVQLNVGQAVTVVLPFAGQRRVAARITALGGASGRPGRLFPILVALDSAAGLMPGMSAELELSILSGGQLLIPITAVVNPGGATPSVYRIRNGVAQRVEVEVAQLLGEKVAVRGDLQPGDQVVSGGFFGLIDGDAVEVIP